MTTWQNPFEEEKDEWYFWDEIHKKHGPFESEEEARYQLHKYCRTILGPPSNANQWHFNGKSAIIPKMVEVNCTKLSGGNFPFSWKKLIYKRGECSQFQRIDVNSGTETITIDFDQNKNNAMITYQYEH
jgi:hypothetical protein